MNRQSFILCCAPANNAYLVDEEAFSLFSWKMMETEREKRERWKEKLKVGVSLY